MTSRHRIHLVDASPYIFRAYFSMPSSIKAPDGSQVNAVYGFATFLLKLAQDEGLTHAAVTFDESLTTSFRNEMLPSYKAQRVLPPQELEAQLKACQEMASALGFATFVSHRYEADDIIATLCRQLTNEGHQVVVVTSDKDMAQLVTADVSLHDPAKGTRHGPEDVRNRWGVPPDRIIDLMGLMGDSVDNIPGVPGIGPKTASALVQRFGSLEDLYARLDDPAPLVPRLSPSVHSKLLAHREQAALSKRLATLAFDAPMSASAGELAWKGPDASRVLPLCDRLGFRRMADGFRPPAD